jgi:hypothetical protein
MLDTGTAAYSACMTVREYAIRAGFTLYQLFERASKHRFGLPLSKRELERDVRLYMEVGRIPPYVGNYIHSVQPRMPIPYWARMA